jgi:hypothetical protein
MVCDISGLARIGSLVDYIAGPQLETAVGLLYLLIGKL